MAKTQKSSLAAKLGEKGRKAHEEHKDDPIKLSAGGDLPAGIEGGEARVALCKFDEYKSGPNQGEQYFMASAIVITPKEYAGLRTSIGPIPLCDTTTAGGKTTPFADHYATMLNELKKLRGSEDAIEFDELEGIAAELQEEQPGIRFRTWAFDSQVMDKSNGKFVVKQGSRTLGSYKTEGEANKKHPYLGKESRVNHDWRGRCEIETDDSDDGVQDNSQAAEEPAESAAPAWDEDELKGLATKADKGDKKAIADLSEKCETAGLDAESYDKWIDVANALLDGVTSAESAGEEESSEESSSEESTEETSEEESVEDETPKVKDIFRFKPLGKDKKRVKKAVECEVTAVDEGNETVVLKNLEDGKTIYKGVKFGLLEGDEK